MMEIDDYMQAMIVIDTRIKSLEQINFDDGNREGVQFVMDRFLRIKYEIERNLKALWKIDEPKFEKKGKVKVKLKEFEKIMEEEEKKGGFCS